MLQVLKGRDLKNVPKQPHSSHRHEEGKDKKQSFCNCSHSFYIMSFLDLHSKICKTLHAVSLRGGFYYDPMTEPEAYEGMSK